MLWHDNYVLVLGFEYTGVDGLLDDNSSDNVTNGEFGIFENEYGTQKIFGIKLSHSNMSIFDPEDLGNIQYYHDVIVNKCGIKPKLYFMKLSTTIEIVLDD